ncbi:hypothetical protein ESCO_004451 [Escovopsis weberi]|uniref:Cyclase n=1 Tax=Escovopsis weberi TaxID=150374 RepID=A0A0M8MY22_ESCWE|nr:hypothetical protein ESCO_004451 [Escovopsis weberi]
MTIKRQDAAQTLQVPDYDELPLMPGHAHRCAWGVFDKPGHKDTVGTLNFLTPEVVAAAAREVVDGVPISLNLPLNADMPVPTTRGRPQRTVTQHMDLITGQPIHAFDDEIHFNTQYSSQWDSLCHFGHHPSGLTYNNSPLSTDLLAAAQSTADNPLPTLDHWHARGCLAARGVLLDYKAFAEDTGIDFDYLRLHRITVADLEAVVAHQRTEIRPGDVLIIRTGFMELAGRFPNGQDDLSALGELFTSGGGFSGIHGGVETVRWLWNKRIAAVTGDSHAFEAFPPLKEDGSLGTVADMVLHQHLLAMLGMPIGELWDLGRLSEYCRQKGRYSFFLTSVPLNHPELIGSPSNAVAIM